DGSRQGVLERVEEKKEEKKVEETAHQPALPIMPVIMRPTRVEGVTYEAKTPVGDTFVTINHTENKEPFEVFVTIGKSGSDVGAMAEAIGRMISLNLRLNGMLPARERVRQIIAQLAGIGGARSVGFGPNRVRSLPDAISKVLSQHFGFAVNGKVTDKKIIEEVMASSPIEAQSVTNGVKVEEEIPQKQNENSQQLSLVHASEELSTTNIFDICPECGTGSFAYEEGCKKCYSCGYSEC
ncbi:MAG: ribonucleoside-diphosphate reductase, adenosylcobalamin-dependent, partial [Patescibacteria group bacterium]|nr:ribonucleoside-diphosphate reductase, adenosylcobalamin-dependent [Patescibacteria group bacterium]